MEVDIEENDIFCLDIGTVVEIDNEYFLIISLKDKISSEERNLFSMSDEDRHNLTPNFIEQQVDKLLYYYRYGYTFLANLETGMITYVKNTFKDFRVVSGKFKGRVVQ